MTHEPFIVITAPHFVAGIGLRYGYAVEYPPIVKYMAGWRATKIEEYATSKGWKFEWIDPKETVNGS